MKLIVSGGSPLSRVTEEFLRVCFQCPVVQGYGLTETCGGSFISIPNDNVSLQHPNAGQLFQPSVNKMRSSSIDVHSFLLFRQILEP